MSRQDVCAGGLVAVGQELRRDPLRGRAGGAGQGAHGPAGEAAGGGRRDDDLPGDHPGRGRREHGQEGHGPPLPR